MSSQHGSGGSRLFSRNRVHGVHEHARHLIFRGHTTIHFDGGCRRDGYSASGGICRVFLRRHDHRDINGGIIAFWFRTHCPQDMPSFTIETLALHEATSILDEITNHDDDGHDADDDDDDDDDAMYDETCMTTI